DALTSRFRESRAFPGCLGCCPKMLGSARGFGSGDWKNHGTGQPPTMPAATTLIASSFLNRLFAALGAILFALATITPGEAKTQTPAQWVEAFWPTAKAGGV